MLFHSEVRKNKHTIPSIKISKFLFITLTFLNLAPDTITKQKAEIKEKYFNVSEKQSLDRFLEKLLW